MAKKKKKSKELELTEPVNGDHSEKAEQTETEEFEMAGSEVMGFLKNIWREGNIRRVIVQNEAGETVLNIPVAVGALGLFPPFTATIIGVTAIGAAVAILTKCKITIERRATEGNGEVG